MIKHKVLITIIVLFMISCKDQKAMNIAENKLHIIQMSIVKDSTLNLNDVEPAIIFLERTTGIMSESNVNYIGRYQPTSNDYRKWSQWIRINKDKLYWDSIDQKVRIKK